MQIIKKSLVVCVLFTSVAIFLAGCDSSSSADAIDLSREDVVSVHDIFSEIRIVMPETHPDYLISTLSSIEYHKDKYYIFDSKSQQVFCLDEEGRFQFKISAQGHGPGEYVYLGHMSIDTFNDQILLLEPSMQRLQVFNLEGHHVNTYNITAEVPLAYNYAFALNADTLLLISITGDQLIFFCRDKQEILNTEFPLAITDGVFPFMPSSLSFYRFNNKAFFLPVLSQEIVDITHMQPEPYFAWDFGADNNSSGQYENLIDELVSLGRETNDKLPHDFVGRGKTINHEIVKVAETSRYKIAIVEFDDDYKNIIIDKKEGTNYVFRAFEEGVGLLFLHLFEEMAMGSAAELDYVPQSLSHRVLSRFHESVLNEADKMRLKDWDEMTDNMFFVVYKFKE